MHNERALNGALFFMVKPFKIPRSVLVVVYTPELDVLLMRRADVAEAEFWQSVTGSKDRHWHTYRETAVREVAEETGIDCRAVSGTEGTLINCLTDWKLENRYAIYPRWLHRYAPGTVENRERVFGLQVPAGTTVKLNPREHTAHCWLPFVEAADRCFSASNAEAILMLPRMLPETQPHTLAAPQITHPGLCE